MFYVNKRVRTCGVLEADVVTSPRDNSRTVILPKKKNPRRHFRTRVCDFRVCAE